MYLLDTNVISEVRKAEGCHARVARWYERAGDGHLFLSVIVLGEIRRGMRMLARRDARRAKALDEWFAALKGAFAGRILPVSEAVAEAWGELNAERTYPAFDGLLAATALAHDLILVTRNTDDVRGSRVRVLNPFVSARVRVAR